MSTRLDTTTRSGTSPIKVAVASFIGTTVEFYDFFIYATAAALIFPALFFPGSSPLAGALLAFASLGVGFFARPLGGVVFGHFGDRVGRKKMLVISLLTMGVATLLIGLLPTHAQIGLAAPILLTILRLVQGFAVGGEWGGAVLMAVEHAPQGKRGFYGAFPQMGAPAGVALATAAFFGASQLSDEAFLSWGWRLPFIFSAALVVVGLVIRFTITESPDFVAVREGTRDVKMPIVEVWRRHPREILLVAGACIGQSVYAYILLAYLVSYGTANVGLSRPQVLASLFLAAVICTVLVPVYGAIADHVGRKTVYLAGMVALMITVVPAFALINTGSPLAFGAALVLLIAGGLPPTLAAAGALFSMMFPAEVRYSGASVGYSLAQLLGGAFAPLIATGLYAAFDGSDAVVGYLLVVASISVIAVLMMPGRLGRADPYGTVTRDDRVAESSSPSAGRLTTGN